MAARIACAVSGARHRALGAGELDGGLEHLALRVGDRLHAPRLHEVADDRRVAVVAQAAGVDGGRDEVVAEGVHRQQRRHAGGVAEVVVEPPAGERGTRRWLDRHQAHAGVGHERQRDAAEVRSAAAASAITTSGRYSPASASCSLASRPMTVWCSSTWLSTDPSE